MDTYEQIIIKIIKEQEQLMGPVAWYEAGKVNGLKILDEKTASISIETNNSQNVVDGLVTQYGKLFGRAAVEVCKDAVRALVAELPSTAIPSSLK